MVLCHRQCLNVTILLLVAAPALMAAPAVHRVGRQRLCRECSGYMKGRIRGDLISGGDKNSQERLSLGEAVGGRERAKSRAVLPLTFRLCIA